MTDEFTTERAPVRTGETRSGGGGSSTHPSSTGSSVLQGEERRLRIENVPPCGWTDLGTPVRVASCLASLRDERAACAPTRSSAGQLVLAETLG